ncbi:MAG TPA: SDR family oxidoreductase [Anaeromyxobacter sp.]|nr:SDR family oxidoreductase [Anaeromyxobacter sp.]
MPPASPGLAVVTGASAGIGAELARQLSRAGRPVLAVARREDRLVALAGEARLAGTAPVHPLAADVTDAASAARVADTARALGGAAWLVNNAGFGIYGAFEKQDRARLAELVQLNCQALVLLSHAFLPQLRASGAGVLLNVASAAAFQPTPFMSVYGASKAFVLSFTEGLAEELRDSGVFVGAYCPGPVDTEFGDVAGARERLSWIPQVLSAEDAAREALGQIARRDVVYVPRPFYKLASMATRVLPRAVVRRVSARAHRRDGK